MKTRGFFAMDVCTIDIDLQSFIDADTMYPCINYTLAFTLFQIKRILFMYACENTKLFTNAHTYTLCIQVEVEILGNVQQWPSFYSLNKLVI